MWGKKDLVGETTAKFYDCYKVLKQLGAGSYGTVYRVSHKKTNEIYACKQLKRNKISDLQKFAQEINIMKEMDHPNIIKLYEVFEEEHFIYLIMEECMGGELFDRIIDRVEKKKLYNEKEAAKIFKQMMSAVNYCHNQGICHRDLKPENLLLLGEAEDSPIKVIDFGLSRIFKEVEEDDKKNVMNTKVGTAYYVSPEVLSGKYDEKCDVWSAGVILYILLTGDPPFNGANDNDIYRKIKAKKFSFPEKKWSKISDDAKELIKAMLSDPPQRLSAAEVLESNWVKECAPNSLDALEFDVESLNSYVHKSKFQQLVLSFVASRLRDDEIEGLRNTFIALDKNQDGTLTLEEMQIGLANMESNLSAEEIFEKLDTDKSGSINYTEFLAATIDKSIYMQESKLSQAFSELDKDGSGKIDIKEIKEALKIESEEELTKLTDTLKEFDLNNDGEIDFEEFTKMMGFKK